MLDFHRGKNIPNWLSRPMQYRLLFYVAVLGLVLFLASEARNPKMWALFAASNESKPAKTGPPSRLSEAVNRDFLDQVEDDAPFFSKETDAWYHLFALLNKTDAAELEQESIGTVSWIQLSEQSKEYRGELVTVRGIVRRVLLQKTPKNNYGIQQYYQVCLTPYDNPSKVIILYCLELPESFPMGKDLEEHVTSTGFSYKRWCHPTVESIHTSPVVLSKVLNWTPAPPSPESPKSRPMLTLSLMAAAFMVALIFVFMVFRSSRSDPSTTGVSLQNLDQLETADTGPDESESLRRLNEEPDPEQG